MYRNEQRILNRNEYFTFAHCKYSIQSNYINRRLMQTEHSIGQNTHPQNTIKCHSKIKKMHQTYRPAQPSQKIQISRYSMKALNPFQKTQIKRAKGESRMRKSEQLHYMIYNNLKNEKVLQKIQISNIKQFLKIEKAPLVQKKIESLQNIKNIHIRYSKVKGKRQSKLPLLVASSRQSRISKDYFSNIFCNSNQFYYNQFKQTFQSKLNKYLQKIERICTQQNLTYKQVVCYSQLLKYTVDQGNNSALVEKAFRKRWWWTTTESGESSTYAKWTQIRQNHCFQSNNGLLIQNHLEFNRYLTSKVALYQIINKSAHLCSNVPKMYLVKEMEDLRGLRQLWEQRRQKGSILLSYLIQDKRRLWIVKQLSSQHHNKILKIVKTAQQVGNIITPATLKNSSFIIQQYIQRPFLYNHKKIHVKVFILITNLNQNVHLYWYKDGYICLATETYNQHDICNAYIHFTTENIQINHHNFGEEEPSNKISFQKFQAFLNAQQSNDHCSFDDTQIKMKEFAILYISQLKSKIQKGSHPTFQLLQMNFILDEQLTPWLISIHTNPFIEETCPLLQGLFPNLIDDILKLTIDLIVPPPLTWPQNKMNLFTDSMLENGFEQLVLGVGGQQFVFENEDEIYEQIKYYERIAEEVEPRLLTE